MITSHVARGPPFANVDQVDAAEYGIAASDESAIRDPTRGRFAAATRYADRLAVFNTRGELIARAARPASFEPMFTVAQAWGVPQMSGDANRLRYGFVGLAGNGEGVFALFSNRTHGDRPGRAAFGSVVLQYGWDATLTKTLRLDRDVVAIAVDPTGTHLYALCYDRLPAVLVYRLRK